MIIQQQGDKFKIDAIIIIIKARGLSKSFKNNSLVVQ
jgi:hypothetical protein